MDRGTLFPNSARGYPTLWTRGGAGPNLNNKIWPNRQEIFIRTLKCIRRKIGIYVNHPGVYLDASLLYFRSVPNYSIEFMINRQEKISEKTWISYVVWFKPNTGKVKKSCAVMCMWNFHLCQLGSIVKGAGAISCSLFYSSSIGRCRPATSSLVVHAAYAVEFYIELFGRTVVSSGYSFPVFHMCKDIFDRNAPFVMCLVLCLFGGGKLFALGFCVGSLRLPHEDNFRFPCILCPNSGVCDYPMVCACRSPCDQSICQIQAVLGSTPSGHGSFPL